MVLVSQFHPFSNWPMKALSCKLCRLSALILNPPNSPEISQLCFNQNVSGDRPIMAILGQNMEDLAQELWKYMEENDEGDGLKLGKVIAMEKKRKKIFC